MNYKNEISIGAFDRTVQSLCIEIDDLRSERDYWKCKYENEVRERIDETNERFKSVQKDLGNALMFALSVTDDAEGNLVIPKEKRKELAACYKAE